MSVDREAERRSMVARQLVTRGIRDLRVLEAMARVPRERFVPAEYADLAYADRALPIEAGQTISQPYVVALTVQALQIDAQARVLEVGAGSGYAAAVLGEIAREVHTVERHAALARAAARRLAELGYANVHVHEGDGTRGWPGAAPFDAIAVAAGGPVIPESLKQQLADGGRLVIPVGPTRGKQSLLRVVRAGDRFTEETLDAVAFVPLVGAEGWDDAGAAPPGAAPEADPGPG